MEVEESLQESESAEGGGKDKKKKKKKNKNKGIDEENLLESKSANPGEKDRMKKKKNKDTTIEEIRSEVTKSPVENSDTEVEDNDTEDEDFWMPPVGDRWDHDDGGDRWGSESESESVQEIEDGNVIGMYTPHVTLHLMSNELRQLIT